MDMNDRLHRLIMSINSGAKPPHNMYEIMTSEIGLSTLYMGDLIEMALEATCGVNDRVGDTKITTLLNMMEVVHSAQCKALKYVSNEISDLREEIEHNASNGIENKVLTVPSKNSKA